MLCFSIAILLATTCLLVSAGYPSVTVTSCERNTIHRLSCEIGVISVQTVLYGRADTVTCREGRTEEAILNTQCSVEGAVDVIKKWCEGKRTCELNTAIFELDPCRNTHKYLQTKYTCLPITHRIICEHSLVHLECAEGQVISVFSADYGRHDMTTCSHSRPYNQIQKTDCSSPNSKVAESCNGKNNCTILAGNSVFGDPCVGTHKYLEMAYDCEYPAVSQEDSV